MFPPSALDTVSLNAAAAQSGAKVRESFIVDELQPIFLSAITGAIPLPDFMSDENLGRILAAAKYVEFPA